MIEHDADHETMRDYTDAGVCGIRLDLFKRAELPLEEIEAYITAMVAKVAPYGWHLQFYAPGYIVRDLIDFLGTLEIDFMIAHMGYMLEEEDRKSVVKGKSVVESVDIGGRRKIK